MKSKIDTGDIQRYQASYIRQGTPTFCFLCKTNEQNTRMMCSQNTWAFFNLFEVRGIFSDRDIRDSIKGAFTMCSAIRAQPKQPAITELLLFVKKEIGEEIQLPSIFSRPDYEKEECRISRPWRNGVIVKLLLLGRKIAYKVLEALETDVGPKVSD